MKDYTKAMEWIGEQFKDIGRIAGGAALDSYLGQHPKDFDIITVSDFLPIVEQVVRWYANTTGKEYRMNEFNRYTDNYKHFISPQKYVTFQSDSKLLLNVDYQITPPTVFQLDDFPTPYGEFDVDVIVYDHHIDTKMLNKFNSFNKISKFLDYDIKCYLSTVLDSELTTRYAELFPEKKFNDFNCFSPVVTEENQYNDDNSRVIYPIYHSILRSAHMNVFGERLSTDEQLEEIYKYKVIKNLSKESLHKLKGFFCEDVKKTEEIIRNTYLYSSRLATYSNISEVIEDMVYSGLLEVHFDENLKKMFYSPIKKEIVLTKQAESDIKSKTINSDLVPSMYHTLRAKWHAIEYGHSLGKAYQASEDIINRLPIDVLYVLGGYPKMIKKMQEMYSFVTLRFDSEDEDIIQDTFFELYQNMFDSRLYPLKKSDAEINKLICKANVKLNEINAPALSTITGADLFEQLELESIQNTEVPLEQEMLYEELIS